MNDAPIKPIGESSESAACTSHHAEAPAPLTVRPPRRSTDVLLFVACASSIVACAWWALGTSHHSSTANEPGEPADSVPAARDKSTRTDSPIALDLAAFRTPIWVAPPHPPAQPESAPQPKPEPPPPPPPPLKWQLLAIVRAHSDMPPHAMIYDPESDSVHELAAGDAHSGAIISAVHADRVIIRRGRHTHTLLLDPRVAATPSPAEGAP
ncbi:MAG: hypothetical protein KF869_15635 [Phycisphaeraceae bacterium]|nr:hypothetical protein [Phycisphaeraceae bacterium]